MDESLRFTLLRQGARGSFSLNDEEVIGKHRWELPGELIQPSSWDEHRADADRRAGRSGTPCSAAGCPTVRWSIT